MRILMNESSSLPAVLNYICRLAWMDFTLWCSHCCLHLGRQRGSLRTCPSASGQPAGQAWEVLGFSLPNQPAGVLSPAPAALPPSPRVLQTVMIHHQSHWVPGHWLESKWKQQVHRQSRTRLDQLTELQAITCIHFPWCIRRICGKSVKKSVKKV